MESFVSIFFLECKWVSCAGRQTKHLESNNWQLLTGKTIKSAAVAGGIAGWETQPLTQNSYCQERYTTTARCLTQRLGKKGEAEGGCSATKRRTKKGGVGWADGATEAHCCKQEKLSVVLLIISRTPTLLSHLSVLHCQLVRAGAHQQKLQKTFH